MEPDIRRSASDAFLAAIIDSSEDAIISKTLDGIITSWNPAAERLFGYKAEEAIGQPITMLFPPDRLAEEVEILARIRRGERVENFDAMRRGKGGELIEVSVSISPIRDHTGRIIGASKIARDLRPQKRAQEQFRLTLASISDAVIATDRRGHITFLNPVAESLVGWPAHEARGRPIEEVFRIINEDTREPMESPVATVLRKGQAVELENHTCLVSRDGYERPIDDAAAPIRTGTGELVGVVLVFRDVADRRAAQLAAKRLAAIVEGSHDAIIAKDLNGIVTSWNSAAERTFGYTAAEMIGRPSSILFPPDRLDEEELILARVQRGVHVKPYETTRRRKDGTLLEVSLSISPIRDGDGRIVGASKIVRDISAQKTAERALREAQAQMAKHAAELEEKVRQRTAELSRMAGEAQAFSYSLSHDIRAPLRAIRGFAELVLTEFGEKIPEGVPYLHRITRAAERMDRMLTDVLSFSRITQQDILIEPIDVEPLVDDIIAERRHLQPPAAEIKVDHPLARVMANTASLTQVLTNLLDNAVKFVAPGVRPKVRVFTSKQDDRVRLCVQDNGIGISPEDQARLFNVFQRLHASHKYEGTGLGLAIVRRAAERMGGSAGLSSMPGEGSTFWVELRAAP